MNEVSFSFDDKIYKGHHGEPMSAALLRNGLLSITNSTYHGRPRGVVGLGVEQHLARAAVQAHQGALAVARGGRGGPREVVALVARQLVKPLEQVVGRDLGTARRERRVAMRDHQDARGALVHACQSSVSSGRSGGRMHQAVSRPSAR